MRNTTHRCKAAASAFSAANPQSFVRNLLQLLQLWGMNVLSKGNTFQPLAGLWEGLKWEIPTHCWCPLSSQWCFEYQTTCGLKVLHSRSSLCWPPACSSSHKVEPANIVPNFLLHCGCGSGPGKALHLLEGYSCPKWSEEIRQTRGWLSSLAEKPAQRQRICAHSYEGNLQHSECSIDLSAFLWREPWQWASLHNT